MKEFKRTFHPDYPLEKIDPGNRFREEYGDLNALAESFDIAGCIHPVSTRIHKDPVPPFEVELMAGGRRFFAMIMNGRKTAPVFIYEEISDEELRLIEKVENAQRKDLEWTETVKLDAEIHRLQMERHGAGEARRAPEGEEWNQEKTAEFLGKTPSAISDSLKLAKALEEHPEIAQCAKASQARNFLKSLERSEKAKAIAERVMASEQSSTRTTVLAPCYNVGDALEGLRGMSAGVADLIEVDPPYGIGYNDKSGSLANTVEYTEIAAEEYNSFMHSILTECSRVGKANSWILLWLDIAKLEQMTALLRDVGYKPCPIPLIWNKAIGGVLTSPDFRLAHTYEACIYAYKGTPKIRQTGHMDVFSFLTLRDQYRIHPTERPLDLMIDLFKTFAEPGAQIVSPFLGSGVSIYAAHEASMGCVGWDLEEANKAKFIVKCANWRGFNRKELEGGNDDGMQGEENAEG